MSNYLFIFGANGFNVGERLCYNRSSFLRLPFDIPYMPVVTTKWRLRWVQPPRLGVRRASSAAPRVLVLLRSHSERGSEVRGRRNCITTNYDKLYTMYLVYYVFATRSETYPMPSLGSEWSEVRVPSPRWSRCRFQSNRNRSVTPAGDF